MQWLKPVLIGHLFGSLPYIDFVETISYWPSLNKHNHHMRLDIHFSIFFFYFTNDGQQSLDEYDWLIWYNPPTDSETLQSVLVGGYIPSKAIWSPVHLFSSNVCLSNPPILLVESQYLFLNPSFTSQFPYVMFHYISFVHKNQSPFKHQQDWLVVSIFMGTSSISSGISSPNVPWTFPIISNISNIPKMISEAYHMGLSEHFFPFQFIAIPILSQHTNAGETIKPPA